MNSMGGRETLRISRFVRDRPLPRNGVNDVAAIRRPLGVTNPFEPPTDSRKSIQVNLAARGHGAATRRRLNEIDANQASLIRRDEE